MDDESNIIAEMFQYPVCLSLVQLPYIDTKLTKIIIVYVNGLSVQHQAVTGNMVNSL